MEKDTRIIIDRIKPLFKQMSKTRYYLMVSNNTFGKKINFFFQTQRAYHRLKSTPLHTLDSYDLEHLETVVNELHKHYQFSIEFVGFKDMVWPLSQKVIQRNKNKYE